MYAVYSKEKFERELTRIRWKHGLSYWKDITSEMEEISGVHINEYVYAFQTNIGGLRLVVYSSVDMDTGLTRDIGSDAVRVIYVWHLKNGNIIYHRLRKHLRIKSLFENLEETISFYCDVPYTFVSDMEWTKNFGIVAV